MDFRRGSQQYAHRDASCGLFQELVKRSVASARKTQARLVCALSLRPREIPVDVEHSRREGLQRFLLRDGHTLDRAFLLDFHSKQGLIGSSLLICSRQKHLATPYAGPSRLLPSHEGAQVIINAVVDKDTPPHGCARKHVHRYPPTHSPM